MAIPKLVYTPVRARRGRLVHAAPLLRPMRTACGLRMRGWVVAPLRHEDEGRLGCRKCKLAIHLPVRR